MSVSCRAPGLTSYFGESSRDSATRLPVTLYMRLPGSVLFRKQKENRRMQKAFAVTGIAAPLIITSGAVMTSLLMWALTCRLEHVVEKYGQKMVAYENSFLEVEVTYHEYKNIIVCGSPRLGREWYGNGVYAPFEPDSPFSPKCYWLCDAMEISSRDQNHSKIRKIEKQLDNERFRVIIFLLRM